jgi:hypothetical protein
MNTNSFFSVIDGCIRIIGIFDGHGKNAHMTSSSAMGIMLDYLRNKNDVFKTKTINSATEEEILNEIKKAFKYTQSVLRDDFQIWRHEMKKEKEEKEKLEK